MLRQHAKDGRLQERVREERRLEDDVVVATGKKEKNSHKLVHFCGNWLSVFLFKSKKGGTAAHLW